ncbi:MAG TPA: SDR family oxidoreductase [Gammaproteobacteria bacterium]|nr:SDR family oxidoreductase [Gammaproteobacteria bacterium]
MDLGLKGSKAVVTGGSRGIGRAIALGLADEGADVAICARSEGPLEQAAQALRERGVSVFASAADVGDPRALDGFLEEARTRLGGIDVLVNNVSALGAAGSGLEAWEANVRLDLMASVRAAEKVIPWMSDAGGGCILFVSSIAALEVGGSPAPYSAAKAALLSYSKNLAVSLGPKRIRVNAIAPGSIEFEGGVWDRVHRNAPDMYQSVLSRIPWGRMGTPEEVADVAVFLASERAGWVTGTCVSVDGAQHKSNL